MINFEEYFEQNKLVPRVEQTEVLVQLEANWNKYDYFLLDCPTGVGKTYVALAVADKFKRNFVLTATKMLQEQYIHHSPKVVNLMGKSNYACNYDSNFTVDAAPCFADKKLFGECKSINRCEYYSQRDKALASQIMATNFQYFIYSTHCGVLSKNHDSGTSEANWHRDTLVIDEAHELEAALIGFAELDLNLIELRKFYDIEAKDMFIMQDDFNNNINVVKVIKGLVEAQVNHYKELLEDEFGSNKSELKKLSRAFATKIGNISAKFNSLDKVYQKLKFFSEHYATDPDNWVFSPNEEKQSIKICPITANGLFSIYMSHTADKFVFMSATMPPAEVMAKELGIDVNKICTIKVDSPFDTSKSPIHFLGVAKMGYKDLDKSIPNIVKAVEQLLDLHPNEKGIIHTGNYRIAKEIYNGVSIKHKQRLLTSAHVDEKIANQQLIQQHKMSTKPTVLLSPSMTTGVDLADDLSRFQILVKLPFASLGDARVKKKSELSPMWYRFQMWMTLMQSAGRSTRSEDDHCVSYILDASFYHFWEKDKMYLPKWFNDRIRL